MRVEHPLSVSFFGYCTEINWGFMHFRFSVYETNKQSEPLQQHCEGNWECYYWLNHYDIFTNYKSYDEDSECHELSDVLWTRFDHVY